MRGDVMKRFALVIAAALAVAACSGGSDDTATTETTPGNRSASNRAGRHGSIRGRSTGDEPAGDRCPAGDGTTCRRVRRDDRTRRGEPRSVRGGRRVVPAALPVRCPHGGRRNDRNRSTRQPLGVVDAGECGRRRTSESTARTATTGSPPGALRSCSFPASTRPRPGCRRSPTSPARSRPTRPA